ncbi:hypothetical protein LOK49_LG03G03182 [Camellia lanceoleosa]|uniref:Uncharacterized protein n=1 Tax=Camellia lanceoleosa TaxID=1840588 RepID=A0ACC0IDK6_9ERIC|nr:hypothetical protein LOK49_LG03G03182 [Camellia lanceoleosa]
MESKASQSISFNILVEKEKNRVVFVESNKDFVDIIFSFMTMPIGTIIRLAREHSLKGEIGCLKNLYGSVENLDEEHFKSGFKEIILNPRSAAEIYCRNLKLNLNGSNNGKYYVCRSGNCSFVSCTESACCRCGNPLELEVILSLAPEDDTGFVKPTARFMITDDFQVLPMSTMTGLSLLSKLGVMDGSKIEERTVNIGKDEVLKLLNCSLASRTPFSNTFMQPPIDKTSVVIHRGEYGPRTDKPQSDMNTTTKHSKINLKLIIHKSNKRALYAEVEENFIELLCSLLVLPIGYVFKEFPSLPFKGCMDNIYKSIQDFGDDKFFQSEEMKAILVDPKLAPGLACCNKLIGIEEAINPSFSTFRSFFTTRCSELSSKPPPGEAKMSSGFMKGPSMFMVTDNLLIKPISPISGISLMNRLKVPLSDVGELEVTMGKDEALHLLVASLISGSALTNAFKSFMLKEPQQEP